MNLYCNDCFRCVDHLNTNYYTKTEYIGLLFQIMSKFDTWYSKVYYYKNPSHMYVYCYKYHTIKDNDNMEFSKITIRSKLGPSFIKNYLAKYDATVLVHEDYMECVLPFKIYYVFFYHNKPDITNLETVTLKSKNKYRVNKDILCTYGGSYFNDTETVYDFPQYTDFIIETFIYFLYNGTQSINLQYYEREDVLGLYSFGLFVRCQSFIELVYSIISYVIQINNEMYDIFDYHNTLSRDEILRRILLTEYVNRLALLNVTL